MSDNELNAVKTGEPNLYRNLGLGTVTNVTTGEVLYTPTDNNIERRSNLAHVRYIVREEFNMIVERTPEIVWGVVRDNPDRFRSLGDLRRAVECGEIDADQWSELAQPHRLKMPVEFLDAFETVGVGVSALFRELEYKLLTYLMRRLVGKVGA